jgi:hypothetical protein
MERTAAPASRGSERTGARAAGDYVTLAEMLVDSIDITQNCERKFTGGRKLGNSLLGYYFKPLQLIP